MPYQKLQASRAAILTLSDTVDIQYVGGGTGEWPCVLYVGGAGDLKVTTAGGDEVTFKGLNAGVFLPVQVIRAWATPDGGGTSASDVIALW
jgi:hypothetical protein